MNFQSDSIDRLFDTILGLQTREDCYAYFSDLCTVRELQDMAQRLDVAIMLHQVNSYQKIAESVETSTATIGRVSRCLNYGAGGYRNAIARLGEKKE